MGRGAKGSGSPEQNELYSKAVAQCGRMLDRIPAGYEADPINAATSGRRSTFSFGEASGVRRAMLTQYMGPPCSPQHGSFVRHSERRVNAKLVSFEEIERTLEKVAKPRNVDRERALREVQEVILQLRPLDRQIIISYIEGMDAASIAEITGLTPATSQ